MKQPYEKPVINKLLGGFFRIFNRTFESASEHYGNGVKRITAMRAIVLGAFVCLLVATWGMFRLVPGGFIPSQDKGYLLVNVRLPDSTSVQTTQRVMERIEEITKDMEGVAHTVAIAGQSLLLNANAPNFGSMYVMLADFHEREKAELSGDAISARLEQKLQAEITDGLINVFGAPPVEGLGTAGGTRLVGGHWPVSPFGPVDDASPPARGVVVPVSRSLSPRALANSAAVA